MKKRRHLVRLMAFGALVALSACKPRSGAEDAGRAESTLDAGRPSPLLVIQIEAKLPDGGVVHQQLDSSNSAVLPVTQSLDVTANLPLHNYRLRILDEVDRALPSDDVPEESTAGLRYHIALLTPLRSGHRYSVLLDAQSGATLDDGSGQVLNEQRLEFRTEGEREKDAPAKREVRRRHRRGDSP